MLSFEDARQIVKKSTPEGQVVATFGWENDSHYLVPLLIGDDWASGRRIVDKLSGEWHALQIFKALEVAESMNKIGDWSKAPAC
ncbi:MAG: hypothetical protein KH423_03290 [Actinomycetaceae bacterium]|nr:hypothetical protein [Actinomycetaceae bacterium]